MQANEAPWQLEQFRRSLKKQLKLEALLEQAGNLAGQDCLLITCGDNNGALNWYFREHGGMWTWADLEGNNLAEVRRLLSDDVYHIAEDHFPFEDNRFDCVVAIDVLEHLDEDQSFLHEVGRVLKPGGRSIVTVPNGDSRLLANRIKWRVGMTPEVYGHMRAGYTVSELQESVARAGLVPKAQGGYSGFFTEMVELLINYGYVFVLAGKNGGEAGHIAPTTSGELNQHSMAYQLYTLLFPVLTLISRLDSLLPADNNHAVIVTAEKAKSG